MIIENLELKLYGSLPVTREELLYIASSWIPIEIIELVNDVENMEDMFYNSKFKSDLSY